MKTQVAKAQLFMAAPQLRLAICAQGHRRIVAADSVLPEVRERGSFPKQGTMKVNLPHVGFQPPSWAFPLDVLPVHLHIAKRQITVTPYTPRGHHGSVMQ